MRKIANTQELQAELATLIDYASSERPSRSRIASELRRLSERMGASTAPVPALILRKKYKNLQSAIAEANHELKRALSRWSQGAVPEIPKNVEKLDDEAMLLFTRGVSALEQSLQRLDSLCDKLV